MSRGSMIGTDGRANDRWSAWLEHTDKKADLLRALPAGRLRSNRFDTLRVALPLASCSLTSARD